MAIKEKKKKTEEKTVIDSTPKNKKMPLNKKYLIPAIILILAGLLFYFKGLFVAATVNGQPIARTAVIAELEKQAGQRALDSMVTKALITQEAKKRNVTVSQKEFNDEAKKIKTNIEAQGQSLDSMLASQGMTKDDFNNEVRLQKLLQKMVGEVTVTDAEVEKFMESNQQLITEDTDKTAMKKQLKESLQQEKLNEKYQTFIADLKKAAKINYFVTY